MGKEQIRNIVKIQIKRLEKLLEQKQLTLKINEEALDWLAERGYDPDFGARPLKRLIQRELQNIVATKILSGAYKAGDAITVGVQGGQLVVEESESERKRA